jgi:hypothetical protein
MTEPAALAQEKAKINALKPEIIEKVNNLVAKANNEMFNWKKLGKTQFSDLVVAGSRASCVEELELFLLYKKSKEATRGWENLPDWVVEDFRSLKPFAKKIMDEIGSPEVSPSEADRYPRVYLGIVQLYLGYLMWATSTQKR